MKIILSSSEDRKTLAKPTAVTIDDPILLDITLDGALTLTVRALLALGFSREEILAAAQKLINGK